MIRLLAALCLGCLSVIVKPSSLMARHRKKIFGNTPWEIGNLATVPRHFGRFGACFVSFEPMHFNLSVS